MSQRPSVVPVSQTGASNKNTILIIGCLVGFISAFMFLSLNVAIPSIVKEFNSNNLMGNWITTSYVLSMAVFAVPFGRLADIIGIRKIFVLGIIIFTISAALAAFSTSIWMLIGLRVLLGVGGAMLNSTGTAMVTASFPRNERGRALGIYIACVYVGLSVSPFAAGLLTKFLNWRDVFWVAVPFSVAALWLAVWKIKNEWAACKGEKFDSIGSVIYGLALIALVYGFSQLPDKYGIILTPIGVLGLLAFLWWETRTVSPLLNISVFRHNKVFIFSNLASLINYSSAAAISYVLSLYLQYIKGFSPYDAGKLLVVQPAVQTIFSLLSGRISNKIEPRITSSIGMALTCLGLFSFIFLNNNTPLGFIIGSLVVVGIGFGLFSAPNTNAIMGSVEPRYYAVASSITGTMRTIGQTLSMGITLIVSAIIIGPVAITAQYYPQFLTSTKIAFAIFAVLCFAGIFASLSRGKQRKPKELAGPKS